MTTSTEEIGVSRPRFSVLSENAAEYPWRNLYAGGLFFLFMIPVGVLAHIVGPGPALIAYFLGVTVYGAYREARRGVETPATLVWHTISLRHLALGELYALDLIRASSRRHMGGGR